MLSTTSAYIAIILYPLLLREFDVPYVFLSDDAFELSSRIMKQYSRIHEKGSKERVLNYRCPVV